MSGVFRSICLFIIWLSSGLVLVGCSPSSYAVGERDVLSQAAVKATQIIQEAKATALIVEAQAQATAMVARANASGTTAAPGATLVALPPAPNFDQPTNTQGSEPVVDASVIEEIRIIRVGFAADGGLILIQFIAPPEEAERWWQGDVSVTNEDTGSSYNEIPVLPKVGPMIGRPKQYGQVGYVMLVNIPPYLQYGATVSVKLGKYIFEHIVVE